MAGPNPRQQAPQLSAVSPQSQALTGENMDKGESVRHNTSYDSQAHIQKQQFAGRSKHRHRKPGPHPCCHHLGVLGLGGRSNVMTRDHFVSQVHLKNFYSPALGGRKMYGTKKRTLETFPCGSEDVCRVPDGNTNQYLKEQREVEEFLKQIEPSYNRAISMCRNGEIDADTVFAVAGFASYILTCTPTSMRLNSDWLAKTVESTAVLMDKMGGIPPPPEELGGESMTELFEKGVICVDIDRKYPQALGVTTILDRTILFGNANWDILINEEPDSPFFTSDFPIAIEPSEDSRILNRLMPLAPDLAVRIRPKIERPPSDEVINFPKFSFRRYRPKRSEIREINKRIIQCAEDQVYYRDAHAWVLPFIKKHADYWIEPVTDRIPTASGELIWSSLRISKRKERGEGE